MDIIQVDPNAFYEYSKNKSCSGFTSLMYLVTNTREHPEYLDQIKYILDNKLEDINKQNKLGWTALMLSVHNYNYISTLETVELLLEYKPDLYVRNINGSIALTYALTNRMIFLSPVALLLLEHGHDVNMLFDYDFTVLMHMIYFNHDITSIEYILEKTNIDLSIKNGYDNTVYDIAIIKQRYDVAELIKKYQDNSLDTKCALD